MAKKKMPVDVKELLDAVTDLGQARDWPVYINLVFDATACDQLIDLVINAFESNSQGVNINSIVLTGAVPELPMPADLCVIVGGESLLLGDVAHESRKQGTPAVVVIAEGETYFAESAEEAVDYAPEEAEMGNWGVPVDDAVFVDLEAQERPLEGLGRWIVNNAPAKRVSMAEDFPFLRHPLGSEVVQAVAVQNAAIGVVFFIPGADMPAITLNQAKMILQIASVYGQPLDRSRIKEVAAVVAGAFGFRAIAREVSSLVPGLGWGIKGAIAYGGTIAMGKAALDYFDEGGVISGVAQAIQQAAEGFVQDVAEGNVPQPAGNEQ